jgi:murein DD-endopeptidase MepM/ murein hydrolase activator NlpD
LSVLEGAVYRDRVILGAREAFKVAAAVALVAASALVFAAPAPGDPVSDAKAKVAAAQKVADDAAARYEDAQVRLASLTDEIARLQQQIDGGEEQSAALRVIVDRRAVTAYKQTGSGVEFFTSADDPIDAARREKLLDEAAASDNAAVSRLARVQDDLDERRSDLEARRSDQQSSLDRFRAETGRLEADLVAAQKAQAAAEETARRADGRDNAASPPPPPPPAASASAGGLICPVRGFITFVDSWHAPRPGGRLHQGVDLMAPRGTPNVAVVSGTVTMKSDSVSGNGVYLQGDDGANYYYFHLDSYEGGARRVSQGDVIGYTGNTGDASGGAPHTHFEIHPGGGGPVNPYPAARAVC